MKGEIDQKGELLPARQTRRIAAIAGSALFLVIAPGFIAALVPWWLTHWRIGPPLFGWTFLRVVGGLLTAAGVLGLLDSFVRFAVQGLGTPAPVFPTRHLVVGGLYRHVRNPIYVALVSAVLGQGLLFGSVTLIGYGAVVWLLVHLFVLLYEEPTLKASFGAEYEDYLAHVPRWIPHIGPYRGRPNG
jgi:protein-S-isoprenylcysteine O-methyltransferase Ste14